MLKINAGLVTDPKVTLKLCPKLEHGPLKAVHGIVLHQTGATDFKGTLASYQSKSIGAHFLIDSDGTIYQTARIDKQTYHVGKIRSRCYETHTCTKEESKAVKGLYFGKSSFASRVKKLSDHESEKDYPARYPNNSDSLGIEVVGGLDKDKLYTAPTVAQNIASQWLVTELLETLGLQRTDVYRHPAVSYKTASEASQVQY